MPLRFDLRQMLSDVARPERQSQRLVDQLAKQREQELEWKKDQTRLYEDQVKAGKYGDIHPEDVLNHVTSLWDDHKGNKEFLKQHAENVGNLHKGLNAIMKFFGPLPTAMQQPAVTPPYGPPDVTPGTAGTPGTPATPGGQVGVSFGQPTALAQPSRFSWPPPPPRTSWGMPSSPNMGGFNIGETVMHQGKRVRINKINPDGTAEIEDMQ